ncbi:MAG: glycosyltransferase family 4 protein [Alphaproteobacteria bacterium]|nr:glycosyltransferase family 4 protein [Alphaproteobacteria bacterium]
MNIENPQEAAIKILHVVRQYEPSIGGLESYVKSMATRQAAKGHDVEILTLDRVFHSEHGALRGEEIMGPLVVHRAPFIGKRRFFIPLVHPDILKKFDIIHVHNTDTFFEYCAIFGTIFKKKMVATTHGGFFHTQNFSLIKKIYFNLITKFSCKAYRALFAISENDFKTFEGMNKNLVFMPNAIEPLGDYLTTGQDYMYFGRLAAHKGIENLIKTYAALVKKTGTPARLHIIGPEWDVKISDLKNLAQSLGTKDRVILHGALSDTGLQQVARQCGFYTSGSTFEGFGMSMLETMAVGMIPLVYPNESFKELIGKAEVGACIDYQDADLAADQIIAAQEKVTPHDRIKAQQFAALYSWDKLTEATLETYKEIL